MSRLRQAWRLLREATGEAKWDDYLAACEHAGAVPLSRREFERLRSDERELLTKDRCC